LSTVVSYDAKGRVVWLLTRSSGKNYFAYFSYMSRLFEVLEPNLMEPTLSERNLTSFTSM
jgi:hypothetical protein